MLGDLVLLRNRLHLGLHTLQPAGETPILKQTYKRQLQFPSAGIMPTSILPPSWLWRAPASNALIVDALAFVYNIQCLPRISPVCYTTFGTAEAIRRCEGASLAASAYRGSLSFPRQ